MPGQQTTQVDISQTPGEAYRVSECCLAEVENVHVRTHETEDWWGSTFTCTACGNECATETNQRVVELRQEIALLKGQPDVS